MSFVNIFLNRDVSASTGVDPVAGDLFGLELEHEGRNLRPANDAGRLPKPLAVVWSVHNDGSLRANHGDALEWVFKKPLTIEQSYKAVDILFEKLKENNAEIVCSNRTSTHVHFNMSDKGVYQVINTFFLFTLFEDILDLFCGEHRRGNLFCLSSRLAEGNLRLLHTAITRFQNFADFTDGVRYSSFNLSAINKFGTVEFRAMRGLATADEVKTWMGIINNLCVYGCYEIFNPVDLLVNVSVQSPVGILRAVFKEHAQVLIDTVGEDFVNQSVYEGVRLIQPLVYEVGNSFEGVRHRGPDFWAGLKKTGKKVVEDDLAAFLLDEDDDEDEDVIMPVAPPRAARGRAGVFNPFNDAGFVERERQRRAQARLENEQRLAQAQIQRLRPLGNPFNRNIVIENNRMVEEGE